MQCIDFTVDYAVQSAVLPPVLSIKKGLTRTTINQNLATIHTPGKFIRIVDLNNFAVVHCLNDKQTIAATCFNPIATLSDSQARKRIVLLNRDAISTCWSNETTALRVQSACLEDHVFLNTLVVGQLQRVYFMGVSNRQLTIFALDHIDRTVRALVSAIQNASERVTLAELDGERIVFCQDRLVQVINVRSRKNEYSFVLPFDPTSCHTFREKFISFFNASTSELHSFCVSAEDRLVVPTVVRVLDSNPLHSAQLISRGSDALYLLDECERRIRTFHLSGQVKYAGYNPITKEYGFNHVVSSLKKLCFETMQRAHTNRRRSITTVFAHHFNIPHVNPDRYSGAKGTAILMPVRVENRRITTINKEAPLLLTNDEILQSPISNREFFEEWINDVPAEVNVGVAPRLEDNELVLPLPLPNDNNETTIPSHLNDDELSLPLQCLGGNNETTLPSLLSDDDNTAAPDILTELATLILQPPADIVPTDMQTATFGQLLELCTTQDEPKAQFLRPTVTYANWPGASRENFRAWLGYQ